MGQRSKSGSSAEPIDDNRCVSKAAFSPLKASVFLTDLGWFGLLGREDRVSGLTIGHSSARSAGEGLRRLTGDEAQCEEGDWFPALRRKLEAFAAGSPTDFDEIEIELPPRTDFQRRVVAAARSIRYGCTISYAALAERAGFPRAARAVGSVMSSNRIPIIIPCHRVIAASGKPGGFSAPQGIRLKEQMLALEAAERRAGRLAPAKG